MYVGTITNLQIVFNSPKIPTYIKLPKKYLPKFSYPKKSQKQKFQPPPPPKSLYRPCYLRIQNTVCPPPPHPLWPITATFSISDSVHHAGKLLKSLRFHYTPKVDDWVYFKPRQCFLFWLPGHSIKHSLLHFPDFLHLFGKSGYFSGMLESLLHSSQLQCLLFIISL